MANHPPYPDSNSETDDDTRMRPDREYPGTPRWVKVAGIIVIILILLVVVVLLTGVGSDHGPGRHAPSGRAGRYTPPIAYVQ